MTDAGQTGPAAAPQDAAPSPSSLRLLSFNIQAGTSTTRYHDYVLHSWRHVLPHSQRMHNLDAIAELVRDFDVISLQEADTGSLRSGFVNQTRYLATHSGLPFWCQQSNRRVGRVAYAGNGLLSRFQPDELDEHRLPGTIPGRGAIITRFGDGDRAVVLASVHLALGRRARGQQLRYLARHLAPAEHLVVMGDFNTGVDSDEVREFTEALGLKAPTAGLPSFPSWRPQRAIDHFLVSRSLDVEATEVLPVRHSDHCPVTLTLNLPKGLELTRAEPADGEVSSEGSG